MTVAPCFIDRPLPDFTPPALAGASQGSIWIAAFLEACRPDAFTATLWVDGSPAMAMALEVVAAGPCRAARFIGGSHANGNFAMVSPIWAATATHDDIRLLLDGIAAARPDIDLLTLDRLLPDFEGLRNPLLHLPHSIHESVSLAVDLTGGFEAVVSGSSGKHKRKKQRNRANQYTAAGGHRLFEAETPAEVDRLLDAFFAMKAVRLREAGIPDVFAEPSTQAAFRLLFREALAERPKPFSLQALEVGGKIRAVTGCSLRGADVICEFGAIAQDEMTRASPGEFLFFETIREAAEAGRAHYDFSVGDEAYKRQWCDVETWLLDVHAPLTAAGRAYVAATWPVARLRTAIKRNDWLREAYRAARRRVAGRSD